MLMASNPRSAKEYFSETRARARQTLAAWQQCHKSSVLGRDADAATGTVVQLSREATWLVCNSAESCAIQLPDLFLASDTSVLVCTGRFPMVDRDASATVLGCHACGCCSIGAAARPSMGLLRSPFEPYSHSHKQRRFECISRVVTAGLTNQPGKHLAK